MSRLNNVQRIIIEDFQEEDRDTVAKLAGIINYFMTQTTDVINGNIDYENMNRSIVEFDITVDSNGTPIQATNFASTSGLRGGVVISARNLTNSAVYPLSQPFVTFSATQTGLYKVNNIKGLQANNKYRIVLEVIY